MCLNRLSPTRSQLESHLFKIEGTRSKQQQSSHGSQPLFASSITSKAVELLTTVPCSPCTFNKEKVKKKKKLKASTCRQVGQRAVRGKTNNAHLEALHTRPASPLPRHRQTQDISACKHLTVTSVAQRGRQDNRCQGNRETDGPRVRISRVLRPWNQAKMQPLALLRLPA